MAAANPAIIAVGTSFVPMRLYPLEVAVAFPLAERVTAWLIAGDGTAEWAQALANLPPHQRQSLAHHGQSARAVAAALSNTLHGVTVYAGAPEDATLALSTLYRAVDQRVPFTVEPIEALYATRPAPAEQCISSDEAIAAAHAAFQLPNRARFEVQLYAAASRLILGMPLARNPTRLRPT
ncbi:MAG TPA: hypothetical protein VMB81_17820 [Candidatus Sulfotelmatobacter sp.]|nr:hypothetical protein [Candidatus Sulfotelmatobacter sp.]